MIGDIIGKVKDFAGGPMQRKDQQNKEGAALGGLGGILGGVLGGGGGAGGLGGAMGGSIPGGFTGGVGGGLPGQGGGVQGPNLQKWLMQKKDMSQPQARDYLTHPGEDMERARQMRQQMPGAF